MPPAANPVFANVAVLRIPQFGTRSVGDQASAKEKLERATREAIKGIAANERVVLDTDDGLALVLFGDPARALRIAQAVSGEGSDAPVQAGVNHGPLALTSRGGDGRVFGDGLTAASAAARFATPGKVLVTREFAQMLGRRNPAHAAELTSAGDFTDTRVRQHTFYTPDPRRGAMHRRRMIAYGAAGVVGILLLGFAGREAKIRLTPPPPAVLSFEVKPRGEVIVDGMVRGRAPALTQLEVPPGKHVVRIQNAPAPAFEVMLELKPDFWRDLKKKFS